MFSAQRILITIDGFHFSITEEAAKYLPSCDALAESRVYTTGYDKPVTADMIYPILEELHGGFTGWNINKASHYWDYHRLFLHKYIARDVTKRLVHHPRYLQVEEALHVGPKSKDYLRFICDRFNTRHGSSNNIRVVDRHFHTDRISYDNGVHYPTIRNDAVFAFVSMIIGDVRQEYLQMHSTPEFIMDREIFGL